MHLTVNGIVDVSVNGSSWIELPGASQISYTAGNAPTRQRRDFSGVRQITGRRGVASIQVTVPGVSFGHGSYTTLFNSYDTGSTIFFRARYPDVLRAVGMNNAQVQLQGSNGSATFSAHGTHVDFTSRDITVGDAIKTSNGQLWVITNIRGPQDIDVSGTHASFGPGTYSVVRPGATTGSIECIVTSFNQINADVNNVIGMSFTLSPKRPIGALSIWGS